MSTENTNINDYLQSISSWYKNLSPSEILKASRRYWMLFVAAFSLILGCFYLFGYAFIYGYYFGSFPSSDYFGTFINPIPFEFKTISVYGIFTSILLSMGVLAFFRIPKRYSFVAISFFALVCYNTPHFEFIIAVPIIGFITAYLLHRVVSIIDTMPYLGWQVFTPMLLWLIIKYFNDKAADEFTILFLCLVYFFPVFYFEISNQIKKSKRFKESQYIRLLGNYILWLPYLLSVCTFIFYKLAFKSDYLVASILISLPITVIIFIIITRMRVKKRGKLKSDPESVSKPEPLTILKEKNNAKQNIILPLILICLFLASILLALLPALASSLGSFNSISPIKDCSKITYTDFSNTTHEAITGKVVAQKNDTFYICNENRQLVIIKAPSIYIRPEITTPEAVTTGN